MIFRVPQIWTKIWVCLSLGEHLLVGFKGRLQRNQPVYGAPVLRNTSICVFVLRLGTHFQVGKAETDRKPNNSPLPGSFELDVRRFTCVGSETNPFVETKKHTQF